MVESFNFSDDFQDKVLACMIRHPEQFDTAGELIKPTYFNGSTPVEIVFRIKEYTKQYGHTPDFSVLADFCVSKLERSNPDKARESFDYVIRLAGVDTTEKDAVFDRVVAFAKERAVMIALQTVAAAQAEGRPVKGGIVSLFEEAVSVGMHHQSLGVYLQKDYARIIDEYGKGDHGITTGFPVLDQIWRRGWGPGWLIVPRLRPSATKPHSASIWP